VLRENHNKKSLCVNYTTRPSPPTNLPSFLASSCHLFLCLPLRLISKFIHNTFLGGILFPSTLCTCPNQHNLCNLIVSVIGGFLTRFRCCPQYLHLMLMIHSFIPFACAECDYSLPSSGSSSIRLCYAPFPSALLHQLIFHPSTLHLAIYFFVYLSASFLNSYVILFWGGNSISFHSLYMPKPT